ncbi:MAG: DMT family transporter [Coriobacteriales bacterium]|nr:DMT family transporter [Coriobacteriales bacterium]MBQ6586927.1 DMT family transporter [Coriobacteriales bacterium]
MAFVAQSQAAEAVQPWTFNMSRNLVGVLFLSAVIAWRKRSGADKPPVTNGDSPHSSLFHKGDSPAGGYTHRTLIIAGVLCGLVLCVASYLQQAGITAYPPEAAASGRSGFVTANYMIMVALSVVFMGKRPHWLVFVSVGVAMLGMYFLCVPEGLGSIYLGDLLVFACAVGYAAHILVIDHYTQVDGVRLSRMQLITAGAVSAVCALVFEHPSMAMILAAAVPILYAGIASDGIAYTLQIVGQQYTDATVASIIMSLEAVFAALGGWIILNESLSAVEVFGCALVFVAVILAQVPDFIANARAKHAPA